MKKLLFVMMMICAVMIVQAQTILVGQKFWDGYDLYTVKEIRLGTIVYMATKLDIIEQTNIQLIKSEEADRTEEILGDSIF